MTGPDGGSGEHERVWGVVLAGGAGTRFGGLKQFAELGGVPLLSRVVATAAAACDDLVVVLPAEKHYTGPGIAVTGGSVRAESVRNGLAAVPSEVGIIVITDAAHPLAPVALYRSVIAAVRAGADGAVPGLPLTNAVKTVAAGGVAGETVPAGGRVSAQMPMAFRAAALRAAHAAQPAAAEDSAMVTANGGRVVLVPGHLTNVHVTTPEELRLAEVLRSAGPDLP